jgi:3-carboxy-cis,cis-muconate cycloisomerase
MGLLDHLFRCEEVEKIFSERGCLQGMLDFEAALARAEAQAGVIPSSAAAVITAKCKAESFDIEMLSKVAGLAGNVAIPLVKELTARVAQADKDAARYVHWGATSQDAIDSGRVLQLRAALGVISKDLDKFSEELSTLAEKHKGTLIAGRTWMQQALPTTLGVKFAGWLDAVERHRERLQETRRRCLALQFGGAVGTLAALSGRGMDVAKNLASQLKLALPEMPWHSQRDRMAEIAVTLGMCVGTLGKIGRDISLHMQTEVAEIFEPGGEGRGGSSTMPHKRNPVTAAVVLSAADRVPGLVSTMLLAMVQEDERGLGGWQAEWETLPEIVSLAAGALRHLVEIVPNLEIDTERMRQNLELTHGLIFAEAVAMALAEKIGKDQAHEIVREASQRAVKEKEHLRVVLAADERVKKHLSGADLERLFEGRNYLGAAEEFVTRVVAASRGKRRIR